MAVESEYSLDVIEEQARKLVARVTPNYLSGRAPYSLENINRAIELDLRQHDQETYVHTRRVAALAGSIAQKVGLSDTEIELAELAGKRHDDGKRIGRIAFLVQQPVKLSPGEQIEVAIHAPSGAHAQVLWRFDETISSSTAFHHTPWRDVVDTAQRPAEITIGDIVKAADVYDALRNKRVYKEAWSLAEVRDNTDVRFSEGNLNPRIRDPFYDAITAIELAHGLDLKRSQNGLLYHKPLRRGA